MSWKKSRPGWRLMNDSYWLKEDAIPYMREQARYLLKRGKPYIDRAIAYLKGDTV